MSSDQPQSMDERLKAHASRRRLEAGEPRGLHPASRRLLQEEVRRTYGAAADSPAERSPRRENWFGWFWTHSALAGGICVVVLVAGFAVWPWLIGTRSTSSLPTVVEEMDEAAPPPLAKRREPPPPSSVEATVPEPTGASPEAALRDSARREVMVRRGGAESGTDPASKLTAQTVARSSDAAAPAAASTATLPTADVKLTVALQDAAKRELAPAGPIEAETRGAPAAARYGLAAPVAAPPPAATPSLDLAAARPSPATLASTPRPDPIPARVEEPGQSAVDGRLSRFTRVDRYRLNLNSPPRVGVLTQFQFQQTGQTVRVVDADGSVYSGETVTAAELRAGAELTRDTATVAAPGQASRSAEVAETVVESTGATVLQTAPGLAPVYFRVSGTNRTLRQAVEFSGTYAGKGVPAANAPRFDDRMHRFGEAQTGQRSADLSVPARPSGPAGDRIVGRAVVGGTNRVEVEAVAE